MIKILKKFQSLCSLILLSSPMFNSFLLIVLFVYFFYFFPVIIFLQPNSNFHFLLWCFLAFTFPYYNLNLSFPVVFFFCSVIFAFLHLDSLTIFFLSGFILKSYFFPFSHVIFLQLNNTCNSSFCIFFFPFPVNLRLAVCSPRPSPRVCRLWDSSN